MHCHNSGSRHLSHQRSEINNVAGSSKKPPPQNTHKFDLQKILDTEPPGNFKVVNDGKQSGYRINGKCDKLPHVRYLLIYQRKHIPLKFLVKCRYCIGSPQIQC